MLFHSDRGSGTFRAVLAGAGIRQSILARANRCDNAWSESFIGTLKLEMLQDGCFEDPVDARLELFDFIDGYYNNQRKHSAIGYLTPTSLRCTSND